MYIKFLSLILLSFFTFSANAEIITAPTDSKAVYLVFTAEGVDTTLNYKMEDFILKENFAASIFVDVNFWKARHYELATLDGGGNIKVGGLISNAGNVDVGVAELKAAVQENAGDVSLFAIHAEAAPQSAAASKNTFVQASKFLNAANIEAANISAGDFLEFDFAGDKLENLEVLKKALEKIKAAGLEIKSPYRVAL